MKNLVCRLGCILIAGTISGSPSFSQPSNAEIKRPSAKVSDVFNRTEDSVKKQFEKQKLTWPPQAMYVRSFKYDRQLEVWVKDDPKGPI
jgi:hypothetical protein